MLHYYGNLKPQLGDQCYVAPSAALVGAVTLGNDCSIFFGAVLRADIAPITVGNRSNIQDNTVVHVASDRGAHIGNKVSIGHNCVIHACTIGDGSLIGMGSIIMDDTIVGDNCLVAAGSLLPKGKSFPPGSLIVGSPARVQRPLTPDEIADLHKLSDKYVGVKNQYLQTPV